MLSIVDLLAAKTLDLDLAAYLMARISTGASFMVGSVPGGAGKTTVMCALLNFVPIDVRLIAATPQAVHNAAKAPPWVCYVCHEIGSGAYFAYLWAGALQRYCRLFECGHMLATNLHADDPEQAKDQICGVNDVPTDHFNRFELLVFLRIDGDYVKMDRWIEEVYSGDGSSGQTLAFRASEEKRIGPGDRHYLADSQYVAACRDFLETMPGNVRTIEQTRRNVVEFLKQHPSRRTQLTDRS
ncbi:MAG: hypothetical protein JSW66_08395 [Phycisphaerales bacterium]|nr:MAG: hypothetical protein JSW66_08395 [Phycisphaerales bacterium]